MGRMSLPEWWNLLMGKVSKFTLNFHTLSFIFAFYVDFGQIIIFSQSHFCHSLS
jgi:hypothetical protein